MSHLGEAISAHAYAFIPGTEVASCALESTDVCCADQKGAGVMRSMISQTILDAVLVIALLSVIAMVVFR